MIIVTKLQYNNNNMKYNITNRDCIIIEEENNYNSMIFTKYLNKTRAVTK